MDCHGAPHMEDVDPRDVCALLTLHIRSRPSQGPAAGKPPATPLERSEASLRQLYGTAAGGRHCQHAACAPHEAGCGWCRHRTWAGGGKCACARGWGTLSEARSEAVRNRSGTVLPPSLLFGLPAAVISHELVAQHTLPALALPPVPTQVGAARWKRW
jgi:hypothetical protein